MQEDSIENKQNSQSFYSLDQSKTQFTFIEEPKEEEEPKPGSSKLVNLYGIQQSSALMQEIQENELNRSMHTIIVDTSNELQGVNMHDISDIYPDGINQLECSACLQKEIDCLSLSNQPSFEEIKQLHQKIDRLKGDQSMLRKQIEVFQGLMSVAKSNSEHITKQIKQANNFMKKKCEHSEEMRFPFNAPQTNSNQINIKTLKQSTTANTLSKPTVKHYDIKPTRDRSLSEQRVNALYKAASFGNHVVLLDDAENQYRVEVAYQKETINIEVINYTKGETNYVYAAKLNENVEEGTKHISQKLVFPITRYIPKKFTLSLNILLLIFQQNQVKSQKSLIKIEEIRTVSVPLPLSLFIEQRFGHLGQRQKLLQKLQSKLYVYQIDMNYGIHMDSYSKIRKMEWMNGKWINLKGSNKILKVEIEEVEQKQNELRVVFRIGTKEKETQEAIDLIQYLCFMVAL